MSEETVGSLNVELTADDLLTKQADAALESLSALENEARKVKDTIQQIDRAQADANAEMERANQELAKAAQLIQRQREMKAREQEAKTVRGIREEADALWQVSRAKKMADMGGSRGGGGAVATGGSGGGTPTLAQTGVNASLMAGAVAVGYITAGLKQAVDQQYALHEAGIAWQNTLKLSAKHWDDVAHSMVASNAVGQEFRQDAQQSRDAAFKIQEAQASRLRTMPLHEVGVAWLQMKHFKSLGYSKSEAIRRTDIGRESEQALNSAHYEQAVSRMKMQAAERQEALQAQRYTRDRALQAQMAGTMGMLPGFAKGFAQQGLQQKDELNRVRDEEMDRRTKAEVAAKQARLGVYMGAKDPATRNHELKELAKKQAEERARIVNDGEGRITALEKKHQGEREELNAQHKEYLKQQENQAEVSKVGLNVRGFARAYESLKLQNRQEVETRKRHGDDTTHLEARNKAQEQTMLKDHNHQLNMMTEDLKDRRDAALEPSQRIEVAWRGFSRMLVHEMSVPQSELGKFKQAFAGAMQAEANLPIRQAIKGLNVDLAEATRKITTLEAARQKLIAANPTADPKLLAEQAGLMERVRTAQWTRGATMQVRPELMISEFMRELRAAKASGALKELGVTPEEQKRMVQAQLLQSGLTRPIESGMASTSWGAGSGVGPGAGLVDVSKVNFNVPFKAAEVEIKKNGDMLVQIRDHLGQLVAKEELK